MKQLLKRGLIIAVGLLAAGCAAGEKKQAPTSTELTVAPYTLSQKEEELISKTGVNDIEFFTLDGTLKKGEDIQYTIVLYEEGKFKQNMLFSYGETENKFKDKLISFGMRAADGDKQAITLLEGSPDGLSSTEFSHKATGWTFSSLIHEKVTLKKNKPLYLAGWAGTSKNTMRSLNSEHGELPEGLKEMEVALLYKIEWTDAE
ncbi:hypothetical protein [Bacillus badius]|uniref:hypothetical protein n=1 Tax=Bacillus badius TaxID=1455 RepID=UPI000596EF49|nr:hypothetical protein [Bacillus badius]KIL72822.1 hypothetical protein SD78_3993 [Bacillus badius]